MKTSSAISSSIKNSTTNVNGAVNKSDHPKKEEKTKFPLEKSVADGTSSNQSVNRGAVKKKDTKLGISTYRHPSTLRTQSHHVGGKLKCNTTINQISPNSSAITSKKSKSVKLNMIMNSVHNVTVSSPPSIRKEPNIQTFKEKENPSTRSKRSLNTKETTVLKSFIENSNAESNKRTPKVLKIQNPISFEVVLDKPQKCISNYQSNNAGENDNNSEERYYEDDFECYESDFEAGSSSEVLSGSSISSKSSSFDGHDSPPDDDSEKDLEFKSEGEEDSEVTHTPITVIHREKELERKLDSGIYDLISKHRTKYFSDSFDGLKNFEQLDSGISYENNISLTSLETDSETYGGYRQFLSHPKISTRGIKIMSKIKFDIVSITLLELKPFSYDIFMRMFGNSYTSQSSSQTLDNCMEDECQTDECLLRSVQIQHPPQLEVILIKNSCRAYKCGSNPLNNNEDIRKEDENIFEKTLYNISKLRFKRTSTEMECNHSKTMNLERLNTFISTSALIVSQILTKNSQNFLIDHHTDLPTLSKGFIKLNTNILNALRVIRIFSNTKFNLIITIHKSMENIYYNDFLNLIMVWDCQDSAKPLRVLSTWSEVSRAEICNDSSEIIVCGLKDGSIAMWDMRETYSFCSKLDGHLTHFAATHSVSPSLKGSEKQSFDLGAVVDVRSFRSTSKNFTSVNNLNTVQFASLNETGILAIWTLVETSVKYEISSSSDSKFQYCSPWARVKLIQSAICNLRENIDKKTILRKSVFERTKSNFDKDVFNDKALKELAEAQNNISLNIQGLRFTNLDCGREFIYVGTNKNFVISCSNTLKKERFRKIYIVESGFLFPTAIKLLPNENFLAVGLSNGSTMILNCSQNTSGLKYSTKLLQKNYQADGSKLDSNEFDIEIGKSCAIQNIIRNERLSLNNHFMSDETRPNTSDIISRELEPGKKPYELKIFDEKFLLSGSILRKDLVQSLEFSNDGCLIFALSYGNVRIYDFCTESEMWFYEKTALNKNIIDIATCRYGDEKTIIFLNNDNSVQIHLFK